MHMFMVCMWHAEEKLCGVVNQGPGAGSEIVYVHVQALGCNGCIGSRIGGKGQLPPPSPLPTPNPPPNPYPPPPNFLEGELYKVNDVMYMY